MPQEQNNADIWSRLHVRPRAGATAQPDHERQDRACAQTSEYRLAALPGCDVIEDRIAATRKTTQASTAFAVLRCDQRQLGGHVVPLRHRHRRTSCIVETLHP